jgi:hypothetical protein
MDPQLLQRWKQLEVDFAEEEKRLQKLHEEATIILDFAQTQRAAAQLSAFFPSLQTLDPLLGHSLEPPNRRCLQQNPKSHAYKGATLHRPPCPIELDQTRALYLPQTMHEEIQKGKSFLIPRQRPPQSPSPPLTQPSGVQPSAKM